MPTIVEIKWEAPSPGFAQQVSGVRIDGFDTGASVTVHNLQTIAGITGGGTRPLTRVLSEEVMSLLLAGDNLVPVYNPRAHVVNVPDSELQFCIVFGLAAKAAEGRVPRGRFKTVICQKAEVYDVVRQVFGKGALPLFEGDV